LVEFVIRLVKTNIASEDIDLSLVLYAILITYKRLSFVRMLSRMNGGPAAMLDKAQSDYLVRYVREESE
jgi:hypothetical protein